MEKVKEKHCDRWQGSNAKLRRWKRKWIGYETTENTAETDINEVNEGEDDIAEEDNGWRGILWTILVKTNTKSKQR